MAQNEKSAQGQWTNSLIRFFPCGFFWKTQCCPCYTFADTAQRLRDPTVPTEEHSRDCVEFGRAYCIGTYASPLKEHRKEIRERYGIPGTSSNDFWVSCCCPGCVVMQHEDELKARLGAGVGGAAVVSEGYQPTGGMQVQQQPQQQ
ncbi:hypothetical protein B0J18DRAFT_437365 [Chaetomium sp. MPI-SDFR-AT-0129]|nr:hypothetical protein B0J18DRAFT_437365 [Chaetomium sp. MPI-SDFR-AT-0129]